MENYESELFKREEEGELSAREAANNLNDILIRFEDKVEQIKEKKETVQSELSKVKEDMENSGNVPEQFVDLENRMEANMSVVDNLLNLITDEQARLESVLNDANEEIENGQEDRAINELERAEEVDSQRLDEARQKFENQWSQLLK